MKRKRKNIRAELLRTGMGCFAFAAGVTVINVALLPIARELYGYRMPALIAAFAAALAGFYALGRRLGREDEARLERASRVAVPVCLAVLFAAQVALGIWMEYTPSGDNFMLYNGSRMLAADGCFDGNPDFELYLSRFSNQWGFVLFFTGMWKLFGLLGFESIFGAAVVVQALLYIPGMLSALAIAQRAGGVRARLMLLAMLMLCFPLYLAAGVLYTDTFSLPFVVMALDLALRVMREERIGRQLLLALGCGLLATLGGMIKMTVAIVLIAAVIVWLLSLRPARALACCALCAVVFAAGNGVVHRTMLSSAIDPALYAQHNTPNIHWIMMSIPSGNNPYGGYNNVDYGVTWGMMEEGASREAVMDSIYSRMKDKIYTLRYPDRLVTAALRKNAAAFGDGSFGMTEMLDDQPVRRSAVSEIVLEDGAYFMVYRSVTTGMYLALLLLAVLGCIRDIRRRNVNMAMGYVALFGMMLFLMLWEARGRYFFGFAPVIALLASVYLTAGREA